jgi:hypothetical protein
MTKKMRISCQVRFRTAMQKMQFKALKHDKMERCKICQVDVTTDVVASLMWLRYLKCNARS